MTKTFKDYTNEYDAEEWDTGDYESRKKDRKLKSRRAERKTKLQEKTIILEDDIE